MSAEEQTRLTSVLKPHITFYVTSQPTPLFILDVVKNEEVVSKKVISRHLNLCNDVFSCLPRAAPSKSSLVPAVAKAVEGSLVVRWAGAESEKLHMIWRYARDYLGRSKTSRDFAMNVVKGCFDTGEAGDAEEPAASSEQLAVAKPKEALAAADLEQLQPAPVRRRCLTKKDSVVSVADSAPSPMRTPRAVRPSAFVQLTPCDPRRVRFMTPARCMKTKKTKKTKKTEKTSMKTKKTAMKCMKAKKTEKTSKKTSIKTSVPVIDLDEDTTSARTSWVSWTSSISRPKTFATRTLTGSGARTC